MLQVQIYIYTGMSERPNVGHGSPAVYTTLLVKEYSLARPELPEPNGADWLDLPGATPGILEAVSLGASE